MKSTLVFFLNQKMFCQCDIISHNIPYTEIYIIKFLLRPLLPKLGIYIGILRGKSRVELSGGILSVKTTSMGTLILILFSIVYNDNWTPPNQINFFDKRKELMVNTAFFERQIRADPDPVLYSDIFFLKLKY